MTQADPYHNRAKRVESLAGIAVTGACLRLRFEPGTKPHERGVFFEQLALEQLTKLFAPPPSILKLPSKPAQRRKPKPVPTPDDLLTKHEAAARLRCSEKTIDAHAASGALRYVAVGLGSKRKRKMFAPTDLTAFIEAQTRKDFARIMSLTRDPRSPYWRFDFQVGGHRFFGTTKCTTRREAEAVERVEREKAKQHVAQARAARTSLRLDDVAGRYWQEVGQHHVGFDNTERQINHLIEFFGKDKLLTEITDDDVVRLVAWRRGHQARNSKAPKFAHLISPCTVNHVTKQLKKLFTRAKLWGVRFDREPQWKQSLARRTAGAGARADG